MLFVTGRGLLKLGSRIRRNVCAIKKYEIYGNENENYEIGTWISIVILTNNRLKYKRNTK